MAAIKTIYSWLGESDWIFRRYSL